MEHFETLDQVVDFYYKNFYHFLRFEDGTVEGDGITYKLEFVEGAPFDVLKLSYLDEEEEAVLLCIVKDGILILSTESEDEHPEHVLYLDIISEFLYDLTLTDLGKLNFIFKEFLKRKGS